MSDRIRPQHRQAIDALPKKLKDLAEEIEHLAQRNYESFHDAMCDEYESNSDAYTHEERRIVLEAMGSYWEI